MENSYIVFEVAMIHVLMNTSSLPKEHCHDSLFTASTFNEETELMPSKSLSPALDSQRVLRLVKEVPRSLHKQTKMAQ